ncbi:uncharacterized protein K452DRAFT_266820 [Aplosporella prunicola CBS 121167]|uniref:Uncharacterized protein n=1 Tax=Aplosporella prunicola CBS 121167 TaxID=1176127 RepID=A0A6A6BN97_9PEZI|nr:uncharacterized protein K452DRAFT_266820 [Aplosporella prunicola CBS 121167]KAF2144745.1 hypothetical protein K452DRAFT_266820 [Aplosporella prunicola CBS 121167]
MASLRSLGLHAPAALSYLIAERILPADAAPDQYTWDTYHDDGGEEDVTSTDYCVVWSRGGIVRKVYNFEVEKEKVLQAVLTWFPSDEATAVRNTTQDLRQDHGPGTFFAKNGGVVEPTSNRHAAGAVGEDGVSQPKKRSRALVVFLRTQAHVFFLSGSSHVVNLPFEVERAFPAPRGLLIQRKITTSEFPPASPVVPKAPPNSFFSQIPSQSSQPLFSPRPPSFMTPRKHASKTGNPYPPSLADLLKIGTTPAADGLPRLFSFTDPFSEMGLVVTAQTSNNRRSLSSRPSHARTVEPIDKAEEVLYVTTQNEMREAAAPTDKPLMLVVTANYERRVYSVWYASYIEPRPASAKKGYRNGTISVNRSRRRSSFNPGTGSTTPALRSRDGARESLGGPSRFSTSSFTASQTREPSQEQSAEEAFASQLDPETDLSRQPSRDSRRVSSLLSRADLSTSFDKSAFQDLATHGRSSLSGSFGPGGRRGQSFGGYTGRSSLGVTSRKTRASTPGEISALSLSAVSLEDNLDDDLLGNDDTQEDTEFPEDLLGGDLDGFANSLQEPIEGLRREMVLIRFSEIQFGNSEHIFHSALTNTSKDLPKVFTLKAPTSFTEHYSIDGRFFLYMMQKTSGELIEHEFTVQRRRLSTSAISTGAQQQSKDPPSVLIPSPINTQRHKGCIDASKISENGIERALFLGRGGSTGHVLSLHAGWCARARLSLDLPNKLRRSDPYDLEVGLSGYGTWDDSTIIIDLPRKLVGLACSNTDGMFDIQEENGRQHRFEMRLWPQNDIVAQAMQVCRFVLPAPQGEHFLAIWWNIARNLRKEKRFDVEWAALVAAIFTFAVSSIDGRTVRLTDAAHSFESIHTPRRAKRDFKQDDPVENMWRYQALDHAAKSWDGPAWSWVEQKLAQSSKGSRATSSSSRRSTVFQTPSHGIRRKSDFIPFCARAARDFLQEPLGQALIPKPSRSTRSKHQDEHASYLPALAVALHLLREETKLDVLAKDFRTSETGNLAPVLAQLGHWLDWASWNWKEGSVYGLDGADQDRWVFEDNSITAVTTPSPPWDKPPSVFEWLEKMLDSRAFQQFPTLDMLVGQQDKVLSPHLSQSMAQVVTMMTPRTVALCKYLLKIRSGQQTASFQVETMLESGIDNRMLETFPPAVVSGLREAIVECQANPPTTWGVKLLDTVGREDLHMLTKQDIGWSPSLIPQPSANAVANRDVRSICQSTDVNDATASSSEADRHMITRLIFSEDRRYIEALRLLEPLRPAVAECIPDPSWSESDHLEAQKSVMQWVMIRTFALPAGHSMLQFDSKRPLVTEKFPLNGFTTLCTMKPLNNTVSADRSTYTEERFCWAFFHAGVSAGLSVSRRAEGIDTSWIAYNKPVELSNKHAGLLFGLGLNGHLKTIAKWLSFKYLTPKHSMTSIGLLLGLSVSYMGTMDTLVTRLLSVHVTRMLPPGAADLNLPPLAQTTGLMGIGLLYLNSQHRRMSEIMLSEIEHVELEDPSSPPDNIRDEGYRLAAGFSLGLINLGKGNDLKGLHDMRVVERLLAIAVGPRPVDVVHILDQATAGAVIAVALIFMKTENFRVARKIDVPDTLPQFDYIRPDIFLLRTLAKHIIMWNGIEASHQWIIKNLPEPYAINYQLKDIKSLRSQHMPFYNILAGLLWAISLKYAGTGDIGVRDFLVEYLDQFIRLTHLPAVRYDARLARNTIRNCQDLVALAAATVMAGTGDIIVFRRLRLLHGRVSPDTPYGSHMAAHMALGALFLAGGSYTFGTSNLAVAALVCAFYPLFPTDVLDNKAHLQAFRHFWTLAAEPRCIVVRDVETRRAISLPIRIEFKSGAGHDATAPCLLPALDTIAAIRTTSPDFWPVTLDFARNAAHLAAFTRAQTVHVRRRPAHEAHASTFSATLAALNDKQAALGGAGARLLWHWVFGLRALGGLSKADAGLVLLGEGAAVEAKGSAVDDRLVLRRAAGSAVERAQLEQLRLLFRWAERAESDGGRFRWLGREAVEELRAVVAERARGVVERGVR